MSKKRSVPRVSRGAAVVANVVIERALPVFLELPARDEHYIRVREPLHVAAKVAAIPRRLHAADECDGWPAFSASAAAPAGTHCTCGLHAATRTNRRIEQTARRWTFIAAREASVRSWATCPPESYRYCGSRGFRKTERCADWSIRDTPAVARELHRSRIGRSSNAPRPRHCCSGSTPTNGKYQCGVCGWKRPICWITS